MRFAFLQSRLFEWITSFMTLGFAAVIMTDERSYGTGGFLLARQIGVSASVMTLVLTLIGTVRIAALIVNGMSMKYGPNTRAVCAVFGALLWSQTAYALTFWSLDHGHLSFGVPIYVCLSVGEIVSCYRAARDYGTVSKFS